MLLCCYVTFRPLLKLFQELHYWERLLFETPHYAVDVFAKREELRNLRENVLLVVRDYNRFETCNEEIFRRSVDASNFVSGEFELDFAID
jgi:Dynein heavy chain, N-terminal region 1